MGEKEREREGGLLLEEEVEVRKPSLYKVLLHNDDYTTMEFVIDVLKRFFQKDELEATQIMLTVHVKGVGMAGIYSYEVAEMKVRQVQEYAKKNGHPLKSSMERE